MEEFALEAVEVADDAVEGVASRAEGKVPGAAVIKLVAAEGFFVFGEAVPGVLGVFGSGDTPEIEGGLAGVFGIDDHLDEEDGAGDEFAVGIVGGGVGVVAGAVIIID